MDVIDLDVFVPEPKPTKFTDKEGFELKRERRSLEMLLDGHKITEGFRPRMFDKRKQIEARIKKVDAEIKRHTHTVDISSASFGSSMYVLKHIDEFRRLQTLDPNKVTDKEYRLIMGIVADACSNPWKRITVDYLMENMYVTQGLEIMRSVMASLLEYLASNFLQAAGTDEEK